MSTSAFKTTSIFRRAVSGSAQPAAGPPPALFRPTPLETLPAPGAGPARPPAVTLAFSEAELARACAACAAEAARTAGEAIAAASGTRLTERLARTLEEEAERRRGRETEQRRQLVALVHAALERILDAETAGARARLLADLLERQAPPAAGERIRVEVSPDDIAALEAELGRDGRADLAARLRLVATPRLAPGALSASWPEGWLERDPAGFLGQLGELLAATAEKPAASTPPARGPSQEDPP